jgi:hypothetical protein
MTGLFDWIWLDSVTGFFAWIYLLRYDWILWLDSLRGFIYWDMTGFCDWIWLDSVTGFFAWIYLIRYGCDSWALLSYKLRRCIVARDTSSQPGRQTLRKKLTFFYLISPFPYGSMDSPGRGTEIPRFDYRQSKVFLSRMPSDLSFLLLDGHRDRSVNLTIFSIHCREKYMNGPIPPLRRTPSWHIQR